MEKYPIKTPNTDFKFLENNPNAKGSRVKRFVVDKNGDKAFFKYEGNGYLVSEACSEKMSYEIAKVLGYDCARIELAFDHDKILGVLNYLFVKIGSTEHIDAVSYLKIHGNERPLYDNGCNLLRNFKSEEYARKYYEGIKDFDAYINKSMTIIYKEDNINKYKHFELIEYLNKNYHDVVQRELVNLNNLTDDIIEEIVNKIPDNLLTKIHREYIITYLKKRRDILLSIK